jgi:putative hydrolase of the HAD superfamily
MVKAVLFDLFETLITESGTPPPGVSSLAAGLGCERDAFRRQWKALRPAVMVGRLSFRQALSDITTSLGSPAEEVTLQHLCEERVRTKAEHFDQIEHQVLMTIDCLRSRGIRLGVVSNSLAEDVAAWPRSSLASRFDCTVFSFEVGLAKPDPEIYREATRRLQVDVSRTWFIGDGGDDELSGAEQAGLRPFRAIWFLGRWPRLREKPGSSENVATVGEIVSLVDGANSAT